MTVVEAIKEAIKHAEGVMDENLEKTKGRNASDPIAINCFECAEKHQQVAEWLKDYKRLLEQKPRKGEWLRMSDLSEQEDDRYKCSHCGNVIHYKNKMDLYTFNSWCGRCGSDNGRKRG